MIRRKNLKSIVNFPKIVFSLERQWAVDLCVSGNFWDFLNKLDQIFKGDPLPWQLTSTK